MAATKMRVALIGLGAIGQEVVRLADQRVIENTDIIVALVQNSAIARPIGSPKTVTTLAEMLDELPDIVVEAGGHAALAEHGPAILRSGRDLIVVSVGALASPSLVDEITAAANAGGSQARIVSGAIGGLDVLAAAALGGLSSVRQTTRKPAATLLPVNEARNLLSPLELFRGSAREAALRFPESVNVAAAVSIAGIGLDRTEVRVLADPTIKRNLHAVVATGSFGSLRIEIQNTPLDSNPRTSRLAALSVANALRMRGLPIVIG